MNEAAPYLEKVRDFLDGNTSAEAFSRSFHRLTMNSRIENQDLYSVVMQIFFLAEAYTTVPRLAEEKPDMFITESQMREGIERWFLTLAQFAEDT